MTVKWNGEQIIARIRTGAMQGVVEGIGIVEKRAIDLILTTHKSGRIYRRRGVLHQASAPGEPPASDTGHLVNDRRIDLIPERVAARLTFSALYAIFLERGTSKMEPRPWANRALEETRSEVRWAVGSNILKALT